MGLLASLFLGFIPMFIFAWFVYWLDRFEKEPRILLGVIFFWGAIVAAGVAFSVNNFAEMGLYLASGSDKFAEYTTSTLVAPPVEETLKAFAVVLVFLAFPQEFDSILDGIVYAGIVALGFAATENSYYIYNAGFLDGSWTGLLYLSLARVILVGWQHPFYTAFFGIGLAVTRLNIKIWARISAPILGLVTAIIIHSYHNALVTVLTGLPGIVISTAINWTGWALMGIVIYWATRRVQNQLRDFLWEEVENGIISFIQYRTACSAWRQGLARFSSLFSGDYQITNRFYQVCGELAHKKHQYAKLGDEGGNLTAIFNLQAELDQLALKAKT